MFGNSRINHIETETEPLCFGLNVEIRLAWKLNFGSPRKSGGNRKTNSPLAKKYKKHGSGLAAAEKEVSTILYLILQVFVFVLWNMLPLV